MTQNIRGTILLAAVSGNPLSQVSVKIRWNVATATEP